MTLSNAEQADFRRLSCIDVVPVDDGEVGTKPTDREHNRHFFRNFADPSISDLYVDCMMILYNFPDWMILTGVDYIRSTHDNITSSCLKYRDLLPTS